MEKETETGLGFRVKIQKNGTVVVPAWVRKMVGRSYGEEIDLIAPKTQTSRKRIAKRRPEDATN
jgi:bifunctional DNA-binding transcriptional regulator/antitoxin component of YhaV-PrlF toxin-antitoxin module